MKTIVFNSIQVTNYWFTLHRALRPLYQQAQTSSFNIQGISDQNVTSEMNKGLFTVLYLKDAAFDWVDLKLHEFLDKTLKKQMNNKKFIFSNYKKFKNELQRAFKVVDEKQAAERRLHILKMNKLTVKYATEFQQIAALMDWDDDALVLQYYWGLNETIKDEIVRMNQPEELQNMINTFININSCQWEQRMKHTGHYTLKM